MMTYLQLLEGLTTNKLFVTTEKGFAVTLCVYPQTDIYMVQIKYFTITLLL